MFINKNILLSQIVACLTIAPCLSQDLRGGEIRIIQPSSNPLLHEATVLIHYDSLALVNRPTLLLNWGDGTIDTLPRQILQSCAPLGSGIMRSETTAIHTYSNYGSYVVSCIDSFLVSGITNISNSGNEKLHLEAYIVINPFFGYDNLPALNGCQAFKWDCCLPWVYNPFVVDAEGDSITYQLVPWYTSNFTMPPASVNTTTGDFTMSPTIIGKYAIGYQVKEWRNIANQPYHIGTITRQMLVDVPSLTSIDDHITPDNQVQVYPNPVSDYLIIEITSFSFGETYLVINNMMGEKIYKSEITNARTEINISGLASGVYFFYVIQGRGNSALQKIVKL